MKSAGMTWRWLWIVSLVVGFCCLSGVLALAAAQQSGSLPQLNAPELNPPQQNAPQADAAEDDPRSQAAESAEETPLESAPPSTAEEDPSTPLTSPPSPPAQRDAPALSEELPMPAPTLDPQPSLTERDDAARQHIQRDSPPILLRGPVHEAFASVITIDPTAPAVIGRRPPTAIKELPPRIKPVGEDVQWIPGYWAWDDLHQDFVWLSGIWRVVPPNRRCVPGYWSEGTEGYQWVSGFWAAAQREELVYRPLPPMTVESGPTTEASSSDQFWIPGCWIYREGRYRWRPGYWHPHQEEWVWIAERNVWTPRGTIHVDGYWDYPLTVRGLLFAPVDLSGSGADFGAAFTPGEVLDTPTLMLHLFVRAGDGHYCFGDYYDLSPDALVQPWHEFGMSGGYDPLLTYYQWQYAQQDRDFVARLAGWQHYFQRNPGMRPATTVEQQIALVVQNRDLPHIERSILSDSLAEIVEASSEDAVESLTAEEQLSLIRQTALIDRLAAERGEVERVTAEPDDWATAALPLPAALSPEVRRTVGSAADRSPRVIVLRPDGRALLVPPAELGQLQRLAPPDGEPAPVLLPGPSREQSVERERRGILERFRARRAARQ